MIRPTLARLHDARIYALSARRNASGLSAAELLAAEQRLQAALFSLIVVGEALGKVPAEIRRLAPEIPWTKPIALRHVLVHGYWQIDLDIIVNVIENALPPLVASLDRLIVMLRTVEP